MPETHQIVDFSGWQLAVCWRRNKVARRLSLRVDPIGDGVIVTLPVRAKAEDGLAFLQTHEAWIRAKLRSLAPSAALCDGAELYLGGVAHRVRHMEGARRGAWIDGDAVWVSGDKVFLARRVMDFLRDEAKRRLGLLTREKAAMASLSPSRIVCKDTSSRWGSCTAKGVLMFSWRLVMAPPFVQDYVVAHEVAHLRHMNHGAQFWALVRQLTPHAPEATAWLKQHGQGLMRAFRAT